MVNLSRDQWKQLIEEHNAWTTHNFPDETHVDSITGVMEEVGELAHCHLKQKQGIRKVNWPEDAQDAIADATIYLLGVMSFTGYIPLLSARTELFGKRKPQTADQVIHELGEAVGVLCQPARITVGSDKVVVALIKYCILNGWDYAQLVIDTWNKVSKRDWVADPEHGGEDALAKLPEVDEPDPLDHGEAL